MQHKIVNKVLQNPFFDAPWQIAVIDGEKREMRDATTALIVRNFLVSGFPPSQQHAPLTPAECAEVYEIMAALKPFKVLAATLSGGVPATIDLDKSTHEFLVRQVELRGGALYGTMLKVVLDAVKDLQKVEEPTNGVKNRLAAAT